MICLLPEFVLNDFSSYDRRIEAAKISTYRLDCPKTFLEVEYSDLKLLMTYNLDFFNHSMQIADKAVKQFIRSLKKVYANPEDEDEETYHEMLKSVETLDDLLNSCDYFGSDYESRRVEFANTLVEDRWYFEKYFA